MLLADQNLFVVYATIIPKFNKDFNIIDLNKILCYNYSSIVRRTLMQRINEFIEKLEANKTTPNERRGFISSLTKKEFIYFLKQDFSSNTQLLVCNLLYIHSLHP